MGVDLLVQEGHGEEGMVVIAESPPLHADDHRRRRDFRVQFGNVRHELDVGGIRSRTENDADTSGVGVVGMRHERGHAVVAHGNNLDVDSPLLQLFLQQLHRILSDRVRYVHSLRPLQENPTLQ